VNPGEWAGSYGPIFLPPRNSIRIDVPRMVIPMAVVVVITIGAVVLTAEKPPKQG
jgi:hypothetical protein